MLGGVASDEREDLLQKHFQRFPHVWATLAIAAGVGLCLVAPGLFAVVSPSKSFVLEVA